MWSPKSSFGAARRRLLALVVVCAAVLIAGCGSAPLGTLTPTQRQQFDTLNTAMITAGGDPGQTYDQLDAAATIAQQACDAADHSDPMIASFAVACAPSLKVERLSALLQTRCSVQNTACAHTLKHLSQNVTKVIALAATSNAAVSNEVKGAKCVANLSSSPEEISALKVFASDVDQMSDAVTGGDELTFQKAAAALGQAAQAMLSDDSDANAPVSKQITDFRKACKTGVV